jgi:hypothetical protein
MHGTKEAIWLQKLLGELLPEYMISSASGMERGEVFYRPMDWLGSRDPMTHYNYAPDSSSGLDD